MLLGNALATPPLDGEADIVDTTVALPFFDLAAPEAALLAPSGSPATDPAVDVRARRSELKALPPPPALPPPEEMAPTEPRFWPETPPGFCGGLAPCEAERRAKRPPETTSSLRTPAAAEAVALVLSRASWMRACSLIQSARLTTARCTSAGVGAFLHIS